MCLCFMILSRLLCFVVIIGSVVVIVLIVIMLNDFGLVDGIIVMLVVFYIGWMLLMKGIKLKCLVRFVVLIFLSKFFLMFFCLMIVFLMIVKCIGGKCFWFFKSVMVLISSFCFFKWFNCFVRMISILFFLVLVICWNVFFVLVLIFGCDGSLLNIMIDCFWRDGWLLMSYCCVKFEFDMILLVVNCMS